MMKNIRRAISVSMCLIMMTGMVGGCGKSTNTAGTAATIDYNHVYRQEDFALDSDIDISNMDTLAYAGGRIYLTGTKYSESGSDSSFIVASFEPDGSDSQTMSIDMSSTDTNSSYISGAAFDEDGYVYTLTDDSTLDEATQESVEKYSITKYDMTGQSICTAQINEEDGADIYFSNIKYVSGFGILVQASDSFRLYSAKDLSLTSKITLDTSNINNILVTPQGKVLAALYSDKGSTLNELDLKKGAFGDDLGFPGNLYEYNSLLASLSYDILLPGTNGVFAYNIDDKKVTELCSYIDSDISPDNVVNICQVSDTEMLALIYSDEAGGNTLSELTKVPADEVASQKVLTLGCYGIDYRIQKQIIAFNKTNTKYRITVKDYSKYNSDDSSDAGLTKLNTDIISGDMPDILVASPSMPLESYIAKGVVEPLDSYLDSDKDYDKEDFLTNVFDSYRTDGKMYCLIPSFYVYTVAAKTSDLAGKTSWTTDDLLDIADKKGIDYANIFGPYTQTEFMQMAIYLASADFINWDEHSCNFDDGSFAKLLTFANNFPKKVDDAVYQSDTTGYWRENKAIANFMYFSSFDDYLYNVRGTFGEPITMIGFPGAKSGGSCIVPDAQLCMSASTKNKEGCWEFLSSFLTSDYQDSIDYNFPVRKSSLEKLADKAMKKPSYTDEKGNVTEYSNTVTIGGMEIEEAPLTKEEKDSVLSFIQGLKTHINYNEEVLNIVTEESAPFFEGQKTADQVCDIIQSRLTIYVYENS